MPSLIVSIDTEGDNQWSAAARVNPSYENIYALPRLHERLGRCGGRPVYLITYPVAADSRSAEILGRLATDDTCEIGAHHHAWETPPCDRNDAPGLPYTFQLPLDRFEQQLATLTAAIRQVSGTAPVSYRSGRFGFHPSHIRPLERAGYLVETSVVPLLYEAYKGGPDFVDAPLSPYWLSYDSAVRSGESSLLEVPISVGLDRELPKWLVRAYGRAPRAYQTKRLLRLLRIVRTCWLRPSYSSLSDMQQLASRMVEEADHSVLHVFFHSSEAIVGGSPYTRTKSELDAFLDRLSGFLQYAVHDLDAQPATLRELHQKYCSMGHFHIARG